MLPVKHKYAIKERNFMNERLNIVKPREWKNNIEVIFRILNEQEVESVFLKCPSTSINYNVEVLLK